MRYVAGIERNSKNSFIKYIDDFIGEDNIVRVIDEFMNSLDMNKFGFRNATPLETGRLPFDPRDMLKLYIYGYNNRVTSSRKLKTEAERNIEAIWLLKGVKPKYKVISDFRKDNREALEMVFKQFVSLCKGWGLFGAELVAVDGTKIRACNSKKNNFNKKSLDRKIKYLDEKIQKYMDEMDENDNREANTPEPSAEEIKQMIKELKNRKEKYEGYQKELKEKDISEISITDRDARLMSVNNNGVDVCYNVQTVVDSKHCLVVDCNVINNPTDHGQLSEMANRAKDAFGVDNINALADKGYYNADDLKVCEKEQITTYVAKQIFSNATGEKEFYSDKFIYDKEKDVYTCPAGHVLSCSRKRPVSEDTEHINYSNSEACKSCEFKDKCTKSKNGRTISRSVDQDFLDTVDERTKANKDLYKKRQMIVEHPFGTVKRNMGFTYFLTRGLKSVKTEVSLTFLAYNIKRVCNILGIREMIRRIADIKSFAILLSYIIRIFIFKCCLDYIIYPCTSAN